MISRLFYASSNTVSGLLPFHNAGRVFTAGGIIGVDDVTGWEQTLSGKLYKIRSSFNAVGLYAPLWRVNDGIMLSTNAVHDAFAASSRVIGDWIEWEFANAVFPTGFIMKQRPDETAWAGYNFNFTIQSGPDSLSLTDVQSYTSIATPEIPTSFSLSTAVAQKVWRIRYDSLYGGPNWAFLSSMQWLGA